MNQLTVSCLPTAGRSLKPNRVSIWPVEGAGFGLDFTYHGATGYSVRFGPLPRDHMRAVLDHFAW